MHYLKATAIALVLLGGCAVWFNKTLRVQWQTGFVAGQAAMKEQYQQKVRALRVASQAAHAASVRRAAQLENRHEEIQKKLAGLAGAIRKDAGANADCLSPDVMRALSKTGSAGSGTGAGARKPD